MQPFAPLRSENFSKKSATNLSQPAERERVPRSDAGPFPARASAARPALLRLRVGAADPAAPTEKGLPALTGKDC